MRMIIQAKIFLLSVFLHHISLSLVGYYFHFRHSTELTADRIKFLEEVFRDTLTKDGDKFTLAEFKRIVPSKNVSSIINV